MLVNANRPVGEPVRVGKEVLHEHILNAHDEHAPTDFEHVHHGLVGCRTLIIHGLEQTSDMSHLGIWVRRFGVQRPQGVEQRFHVFLKLVDFFRV